MFLFFCLRCFWFSFQVLWCCFSVFEVSFLFSAYPYMFFSFRGPSFTFLISYSPLASWSLNNYLQLTSLFSAPDHTFSGCRASPLRCAVELNSHFCHVVTHSCCSSAFLSLAKHTGSPLFQARNLHSPLAQHAPDIPQAICLWDGPVPCVFTATVSVRCF